MEPVKHKAYQSKQLLIDILLLSLWSVEGRGWYGRLRKHAYKHKEERKICDVCVTYSPFIQPCYVNRSKGWRVGLWWFWGWWGGGGRGGGGGGFWFLCSSKAVRRRSPWRSEELYGPNGPRTQGHKCWKEFHAAWKSEPSEFCLNFLNNLINNEINIMQNVGHV